MRFKLRVVSTVPRDAGWRMADCSCLGVDVVEADFDGGRGDALSDAELDEAPEDAVTFLLVGSMFENGRGLAVVFGVGATSSTKS